MSEKNVRKNRVKAFKKFILKKRSLKEFQPNNPNNKNASKSSVIALVYLMICC